MHDRSDGWQRVRLGHEVREILEVSGLDPRSREAELLKLLAMRGRGGLLRKVARPLIERGMRRVMDDRIFSLPSQATEGILLGTSTDLFEHGPEVRLSADDLVMHAGVFGRTGSGKSFTVKSVIAQLIAEGVPVWVFDVEGEYRSLVPLFPRERLWWVRWSWVKVNPFQIRGEPDAWIGRVIGLMRSVFFMRDGGTQLLSTVLRELYLRRGCLAGSGRWPTLSIVHSHLRSLRFAQNSRNAGYLESAMRVIQTMLDGLGAGMNVSQSMPIRELTSRSVIFDVSDLGRDLLEFFVVLLLALAELG